MRSHARYPGKVSFEFTDMAVQTSVGTEMDASARRFRAWAMLPLFEVYRLVFEHASRH